MYNGEKRPSPHGDKPGPPRAVHLRRPVQAGRGVPTKIADGSASPAGTRSVPGRHLLTCTPALLERAGRAMSDEYGGRLAHGAAHDQDAAGENVSRLHPDQRPFSFTTARFFLSTTCSSRASGPAVNSASRVARPGGSAPGQGLKQVAGTLRHDLASSRAAGRSAVRIDLDKSDPGSRSRGAPHDRALKQVRYVPIAPSWIRLCPSTQGAHGYLDDISGVRRRPLRGDSSTSATLPSRRSTRPSRRRRKI